MAYNVYSLESTRRVDSNENTQYTIMLKKFENISLCLLTRLDDFHGPREVRAIEVLLYYNKLVNFLIPPRPRSDSVLNKWLGIKN